MVELEKTALNAEASVKHQCCKGEGKRGDCQSTSPSRNAVSAPPRAQEGVKSWLQYLGNFASDYRGARDCTLLGVMGSYISTELVCQSQAHLGNSSLNRHLIS